MLGDLKNAGIDTELGRGHLPELRHLAARVVLAKVFKLYVVRGVLGHSSLGMTVDVYGHLLERDRQAAAKQRVKRCDRSK